MANPYEKLPATALWRPAVAEKHVSEIGPLWSPKFDILPTDPIVTFGSCFAQHVTKALQKRKFRWLSTEQPPETLSGAAAKKFSYNAFSARTGTILTATQLLQWTRWALEGRTAPDEVWEQDGRFIDPFRPAIVPDGFATAAELAHRREITIVAFGDAVRSARYLIFTMSQTESWWNKAQGYEYPACPGTAGGVFDPEQHELRHLEFQTIRESLGEAFRLMLKANPSLRFILTVSPVPPSSTLAGSHILSAAMESKSILRAVAGQFARHWNVVDYFPAYEMISSPAMRGGFFEPNLRSICAAGVDFVNDRFFECLQRKFGKHAPAAANEPAAALAKSTDEAEPDDEPPPSSAPKP